MWETVKSGTKYNKIQITSIIHKTYILIIGSTQLILCRQNYFILLAQSLDNLDQTFPLLECNGGILVTVEYHRRLPSIPGLSTSS